MARIDKNGLTIKGLKKASGATNGLTFYSPHYVEMFYDMRSGEVWAVEQYDLGHNSYSVYSDSDIVKLGNAYSHWTMQKIADAIEQTVECVRYRRRRDAVDAVMSYEVDNGGAAYETMVDGYDGDFTAYADDYRGDYYTEEVAEGVVVRLPHTGEAWLVWKDTGVVSKDNYLHVYEVIDSKDRTILKTTDEAEALALMDAGKGIAYFEDGSIVEW